MSIQDEEGNSPDLPTHRNGTQVLRTALVLYLIPFLLTPILLFVMAFIVIPSRWLSLRVGNTYWTTLGYGATLRGKNCQVVVYGDSTALVGVNPKIIKAGTGLTVCNIAEFEGMTILNGMEIVDRYLAQNNRPRYLVFLYAPENFDPESQRGSVGFTEAITWKLGQPGELVSALKLLRHPLELIPWAEQGARFTLLHLRSKPASREVEDFRASRDGQLPVPAGDAPLKACAPARPDSIPNVPWIEGLRSKYGVKGTTVLIDSTPMAPCDPQLDYFRKHLSGLVDNEIQSLPLSDYASEGRLHTNSAGSVALSAMVAEQIASRMEQDDARGPR